MGVFSKLLGKEVGVPEWATALDMEGYAAFESLLREALSAKGLPSRDVRLGFIKWKGGTLGLGSIARKCATVARAQWAALIDEHLERALNPIDEELECYGADFEAARPLLKVQVVPEGMARRDWQEGQNTFCGSAPFSATGRQRCLHQGNNDAD